MPTKPVIGIVDDDVEILAALSSLVRSLGYDADCFTSAGQLLDRQDFSDFSCVISDVHMPSMDGLELARTLNHLASGLPVILMTGRAEPGLQDKARANGAMSFVIKPFGIGDLSDKL